MKDVKLPRWVKSREQMDQHSGSHNGPPLDVSRKPTSLYLMATAPSCCFCPATGIQWHTESRYGDSTTDSMTRNIGICFIPSQPSIVYTDGQQLPRAVLSKSSLEMPYVGDLLHAKQMASSLNYDSC